MNRETVGVVMILVAAAGFGTLAIFGKVAEDVGLNTTTLLTFRFLFATILIWTGLALWRRARVLPTPQRRIALGLGLVYAVFSALFFWGLLYIPAGVAGLAFYTYPIYVYVIAVVFLDELLTRRKLVALVLALSGVGLIVGGNAGGANAFGVALVLLAALGYAIYITGNSAALAAIDADLLAGTAMVATTVFFLVFGAGSGRLFLPGGADQWLVILGIAVVGTAVPIFLYVSGLDRIPASNASVLSTIEPVVTVLLGIALLGEQVTLVLAFGGLFILGGVLLIQSELASESRTPQ